MFQLHAIMNSDSELQGLEKKHPDALVAFFAGARARAEAEIDQRYMAAIDAAKQDLSSFSSGELDSLAAAISPLNDYEDTLAFDESDPRDPDEIQAAFHRSANYIAARQAFAERLTRLGGTPSGTALIGKFEPVWKKYNDSSEQRGNAIGSGVLPLAAAAGKASVQSFLKAR
jgi:hypothetical protein